jgi:hypothetical protein
MERSTGTGVFVDAQDSDSKTINVQDANKHEQLHVVDEADRPDPQSQTLSATIQMSARRVL